MLQHVTLNDWTIQEFTHTRTIDISSAVHHQFGKPKEGTGTVKACTSP